MARSRNDSYRSFQSFDSPFLQPNSSSFGLTDGRVIEGSVLAVGRSLLDDLLRLTAAVAAGTLGIQGFTTAARSAIRGSYFVAYSLGAISIFPFYTITDRDVRVLDTQLEDETQYLSKFGRALHRNSIHMGPAQRAGLYVLSLRGIFERGRIEAMPPGPYSWTLGNQEHCLECRLAALNGPYQRDRFSGLGLPPLPGTPGDGSVCLGLTRCGCTVELVNRPLPNADLTDRLREGLLEIVHGTESDASRAELN